MVDSTHIITRDLRRRRDVDCELLEVGARRVRDARGARVLGVRAVETGARRGASVSGVVCRTPNPCAVCSMVTGRVGRGIGAGLRAAISV